ncbi:MAG: hypothetical protein QF797_12360 [Alphaproteobacteria bacterium]|jgi:hypothetical protein|nr:hypothetical protein [Rhodospirillaceae bacterium]MDP6405990.1 hypothetical protein [Alphaproteobacteria bacterium]|tara:strand:- start:36 stop:542 length:507 start_codon:yes stop_codon:yes gene_type:complete
MEEFGGFLFFALLIGFAVVALRSASRAGIQPGSLITPNQRRQATEDAAWKIERTVEILRQNLDTGKLDSGPEIYSRYYIGYLFEMGKAISRHHRVEFSQRLRRPILLEVGQLFGRHRDAQEGERHLAAVLGSDPGQLGAADGRIDGDYAVDPNNPGPYFARIGAYFES